MRTFLTYDYELFMGNNCGSIENCLINPLKEIMAILDKYCVKATFFVDAAMLFRFNELREQHIILESQWNLLVDNIKSIETCGHDVELHIHPQWYYSSFNGHRWVMDVDHYKLSDMIRSQVDEKVFQSKVLLESIIGKEVHAFRAGGYSIQDLDHYVDFYRILNLTVDSTVLSGHKYVSENQNYDYSAVPSNMMYKFNDDITKPENNGHIIEVPITTLAVNRLQYIEHLLFKKLNSHRLKRAGDGNAIVPSNNTFYSRLRRVLNSNINISASFDDANGRCLKKIFDSQYKKNKDLVVISHPKLHTMFSSKVMDRFFNYTLKKTEFVTMSQLCSEY